FMRQLPAKRLVDRARVSHRRKIAGGAVRHAHVFGINAGLKRAVRSRGLLVELFQARDHFVRLTLVRAAADNSPRNDQQNARQQSLHWQSLSLSMKAIL